MIGHVQKGPNEIAEGAKMASVVESLAISNRHNIT